MDETAFLAATATSPTRFATGLSTCDPPAAARPASWTSSFGRSGRVVSDWLGDRGPDWCARVQVAALDPFRGCERALHAGLPAATVVLDAFHAISVGLLHLSVLLERQ